MQPRLALNLEWIVGRAYLYLYFSEQEMGAQEGKSLPKVRWPKAAKHTLEHKQWALIHPVHPALYASTISQETSAARCTLTQGQSQAVDKFPREAGKSG